MFQYFQNKASCLMTGSSVSVISDINQILKLLFIKSHPLFYLGKYTFAENPSVLFSTSMILSRKYHKHFAEHEHLLLQLLPKTMLLTISLNKIHSLNAKYNKINIICLTHQTLEFNQS